ncbi:hypothetical protein QTO34_014849 [Cnephaeus nilssonii]|uniref:Cystatin domain-containing protein n=1 Tax=Cnephaeus nilssonii TaxID=3371016 RepID=A0AA40I794_CNENI|nr:hypothetical protein QTO34_014849 [Eptesicus nilssonii]
MACIWVFSPVLAFLPPLLKQAKREAIPSQTPLCVCLSTVRRVRSLQTEHGTLRTGIICKGRALEVKAQLEEKENKKYPTFKATEYKSQLVAGTNYFIKVQVEDDDFVHIRVFQSLPHENKPLALHDYQTNKTKQDELTYF